MQFGTNNKRMKKVLVSVVTKHQRIKFNISLTKKGIF